MKYEIDIAGMKRELKLFKVADNLQIAAFILYGDVEITKHAARELLAKAPEFDIILTAASKSIPLVYEMTSQAGLKEYVVAIKNAKVYMGTPLQMAVNSITTQTDQTVYIGEDDVAKLQGRRVLIVDDVISTGESLKALEGLAEKAGADIVGRMAVLAEGDAYDRTDITVLGKLPLFDGDGKIL
ncbi:MAG: phosphoribosyltransferase family protein [Eubacteriales bacterium]|nr:phosphoribosyltransferase family protein [Eubacteriales bacterium]